jgi:hypothetical protein
MMQAKWMVAGAYERELSNSGAQATPWKVRSKYGSNDDANSARTVAKAGSRGKRGGSEAGMDRSEQLGNPMHPNGSAR